MNRLIKYEWKNRHSLNGMKGKDYEFKSRSVCNWWWRAGIYTLMMNLKRDLDHRVLMIFFCACTFTDSRRTSTTNFYSESRACFSPKNMKYLEIIAPDIVPVMNKGITHHQVLFTLFPSPRKKPPEHNILNA